MPGDETQSAGRDGSRDRATSGPRHAAPRKSLLTKLHVPAGKAIALAAMPTAVLMGMGLTPHLAQADDQPSSPFKAGPCVTRSETPTPSATDAAGRSDRGNGPTAPASPSTAGSAAGSSGGKSDQGDPAGKGDQDGSGGTAGDTGGGKAGAPDPTVSPAAPPTKSADSAARPAPRPQPAATTAPAPAPAPSGADNPLDPLGLGNLLGGLLGLDKPTARPTPTPAPTTPAPRPPATTAPAAPDPTPTQTPPAKPSSGATTAPADPVDKTVDGVAGGAADAASKAAKGRTEATGTPSPSASPDAGTSAGTEPGGKEPYPCPTYDAKALADARTEGGIPLLPDEPWTLKSNLLTLYGLNYHGIVKVRTWNGTVKDVLKLTATGVDIGNLQQIVQAPNGTTTHVTGRSGSTSTIRNGTVTMYTESLSGNLLGLVPVTFTPKAPPPLVLPVLFFTNATAVQAGQFGGTLHVPGMQVLSGQPAA
ncbi:hydrogenase expression protein HypF [Actinacidiphila sp. ITFR-21]|uniref:hydrogenase expression protein HypF n=1 Tax=Actinacidiphila sp. ITFR-21 TaxID=3075199 RepID=UPI0028898B0B|nr:hydrogenase expression protein HypF [Streptomyces sp. ITFR-21]WNI18178.1 hydrogenase expression protein HypF [Streptomyces sp. ITFR-21]